jgi:hypothetical protein
MFGNLTLSHQVEINQAFSLILLQNPAGLVSTLRQAHFDKLSASQCRQAQRNARK